MTIPYNPRLEYQHHHVYTNRFLPLSVFLLSQQLQLEQKCILSETDDRFSYDKL
jgi:hypothetical protein